MKYSVLIVGIIALSSVGRVIAQQANSGTEENSSAGEFTLGVIEVIGDGSLTTSDSIVTRQYLNDMNLNTVGTALATQAGVSLTHNARNEDIIAIRGFDSRQVPVFLDGIPLYAPYDGYVDLARFTTYDLAQIRVSKGNSSLLYGPNTLGGAVNLVTRKPLERFESDMRVGAGSGSRSMGSINLGTNQGDWYAQVGLSYLDVQTFPLADGFVDSKAELTDGGNNRENAYSNDWKGSLKMGYTPNETDEYALGYSKQEGEKGNPVYTGESLQGIRFWQWPFWDKDSIYFLSNTAVGDANTLKLRVFQDRYDNRVDAYTDATYTTPGQRKFFPSTTHDKNSGGSMEWVNRSSAIHELHLAFHYKVDRHHEVSPNLPAARYRDVTKTIAIEDVIVLGEDTQLRLGVSHEKRDAREVYFWDTGSADAVNGVVAFEQSLSSTADIFVSVSHKTRFPTIKDRYSARFGRALPNPDLQPEEAIHGELGFRGNPWEGATGTASVFYSRIDDLIQTSIVASDQCGGFSCDQAQNIGNARHRGVELSLNQNWGASWILALNYTFLDLENLDNPSAPLTGSPEHRLFAHANWRPHVGWEFVVSAAAESGRIVPLAGSGQSQFRDLSGFVNWGIKGNWQVSDKVRIESGIDNVTDKAYELADGIPMPGRLWYLNLTYQI